MYKDLQYYSIKLFSPAPELNKINRKRTTKMKASKHPTRAGAQEGRRAGLLTRESPMNELRNFNIRVVYL